MDTAITNRQFFAAETRFFAITAIVMALINVIAFSKGSLESTFIGSVNQFVHAA
ncbi:hypothetical protein [Novosphingobium kaempferiae]|uniref:hypothetical protein n=1 Tax=Novosphingobium kaempferiae TaxID=2896849 RepID=UPI001E41EB28|nr:hypothetical protein [Novosphingobium kaempferiae]